MGVLLVRVSDAKAADYTDSWEIQEDNGRRWASDNKIELKKVFYEPYTAKEWDRPVLEQMFAYLEQNPTITVCIIPRIDRFTRGGSDFHFYFKNRLKQMGVELRDVQNRIQPEQNLLAHTGFQYEWSVVSPSRKGEAAEAEDARDYRVQFLTKTISKQIRLANNGYAVRPAPLGMTNQKIRDGEGKKRSISVPDPIEGAWLQKIFTLRAEGVLSDQEICDQVNAMGFKTRVQEVHERLTRKVIGTRGGNKLTPKRLQRLIANPRYCGVILEKWNQGQAVFACGTPLTTVEIFNLANRGKVHVAINEDGTPSVSHNRSPYQSDVNNPDFPYRFVVRCPKCGGPFKGSFARGRHGKRYPGYHCSKGHRYLRLPQSKVHKEVESFFKDTQFSLQMQNLFREVALETWEQKRKEYVGTSENFTRTVAEINREQSLLVDKIISTENTVVKKILEEKIDELEQRKKKASNIKKEASVSKEEIEAYLSSIEKIMNNPEKMLVEPSNQQVIRRIWSIAFEELPTYEEICGRTPKLSLAFELCSDSKRSKNTLVAPLRKKWNQFISQVKQFFSGVKEPCSDFISYQDRSIQPS
ncbi:recombinase family protein [Acanthopleuribacter pedis]|uniref:Recombinase family protein n=1 Tax=Acanthopleuribacter pedis TaxID=442870 RepID=A0A8J7Q5G8_9BACT|nr:recombinase family protein [Acanthopleuribacter pedis]MBO1318316.1 recombinase family protein [Acanthopleuribacter pedis]